MYFTASFHSATWNSLVHGLCVMGQVSIFMDLFCSDILSEQFIDCKLRILQYYQEYGRVLCLFQLWGPAVSHLMPNLPPNCGDRQCLILCHTSHPIVGTGSVSSYATPPTQLRGPAVSHLMPHLPPNCGDRQCPHLKSDIHQSCGDLLTLSPSQVPPPSQLWGPVDKLSLHRATSQQIFRKSN